MNLNLRKGQNGPNIVWKKKRRTVLRKINFWFLVQFLECHLFCSNTFVTARKRANKPVRYTKLQRLELKNMFKPSSY